MVVCEGFKQLVQVYLLPRKKMNLLHNEGVQAGVVLLAHSHLMYTYNLGLEPGELGTRTGFISWVSRVLLQNDY